ncbi:hypothetical protein ANN_10883 [Periplaneta americana]|uniref:Uncharacterized protein n=1 Tax=Periplaneta americana TaxID=6978 RepID=A0ABQ8T4Q9_PERAM|nr:hypothetical protein ANN_10883 [Periplaneta americana]
MIMSRDQNIVRNGNIKIGDLSFEEVEKFKYLGATVTNINDTREEIKRRINMGNACYYSVEKLLSSSLLSKNLKVGIYKTVLLPVLLYGCETWTITLREEHRLRVFENKVLRKIFGAKRDEVTGEWRKLHNTELHALYSSPNIIRNLKSRRLRWAGHVARMGESRNAYRVLVGRPEGKRPFWEAETVGIYYNPERSEPQIQEDTPPVTYSREPLSRKERCSACNPDRIKPPKGCSSKHDSPRGVIVLIQPQHPDLILRLLVLFCGLLRSMASVAIHAESSTRRTCSCRFHDSPRRHLSKGATLSVTCSPLIKATVASLDIKWHDVQEGVIPPFCSLQDCKDTQVIRFLDGINNMLKMAGPQVEQLANMIEECGGQTVCGSERSPHASRIAYSGTNARSGLKFAMGYGLYCINHPTSRLWQFVRRVPRPISWLLLRAGLDTLGMFWPFVCVYGPTCSDCPNRQVEDDPNLVPQSSDAGFQFDPNTSIPSEGFKF